jgi:hypothetical protein
MILKESGWFLQLYENIKTCDSHNPMKTSELVILMKLRELPNSIQNLAICSQYT